MMSTLSATASHGWLGLPARHARRTLALTAVVCVALLAFGLYLQHAVGLEPCPMCIVQRYALLGVAVVAGFTALMRSRKAQVAGVLTVFVMAGFGAFVAARQTWLQWFPPEVTSCGRDLYGMIESFPLKRVIPMVFKGSGDCSAVDWSFLGLTIANWSFLCFGAIGSLAVLLLWRRAGA